MFEEMHLAALIHKGVHMDPTLIGASCALKMATVNRSKGTWVWRRDWRNFKGNEGGPYPYRYGQDASVPC